MKKKKTLVVKRFLINENYFMNLDLDHSEFFDYKMIWVNETNSTPVQLFIHKKYDEIGIEAPNIQTELKKLAFNSIVCNLIIGIEQNRLIALPLGKRAYSLPKMYGMQHYTYTYMVKLLRRLIDNKYVKVRKGYFDRVKNEGKVTRIWASNKMVNELNEFSVISASMNPDLEKYFDIENYSPTSNLFERIAYDTPIILKDKSKNYIEYVPTEEIEAAIIFLDTYNEFISSCNIILPSEILVSTPNISNIQTVYTTTLSNPNLTRSPLLGQTYLKYTYNKKLYCNLRRIFNNGRFDEGGRFYGAEYQRLSEAERIKILIEGNEVVEVDYSGLHGRMVYQHYEKLDYQEDPYDLNGNKELREASKKMFQMIINAKGRVKVIEAFKKCLKDDDDGEEIKKIMHKHHATPEWLYQKIMEKHKAIEKHFGTGIGIKLQFVDSQIAESILKHFTFKRIPCLCIHDSFIVEKKYKDELIDVMKQEYKKKIGFDCQLKINKRRGQ